MKKPPLHFAGTYGRRCGGPGQENGPAQDGKKGSLDTGGLERHDRGLTTAADVGYFLEFRGALDIPLRWESNEPNSTAQAIAMKPRIRIRLIGATNCADRQELIYPDKCPR